MMMMDEITFTQLCDVRLTPGGFLVLSTRTDWGVTRVSYVQGSESLFGVSRHPQEFHLLSLDLAVVWEVKERGSNGVVRLVRFPNLTAYPRKRAPLLLLNWGHF